MTTVSQVGAALRASRRVFSSVECRRALTVALGRRLVLRSRSLDENLVRQTSCARLGDEAVDEQGGQAMNQAPSRHPRRIVFARPALIGADGDALKQTEDRAGSLIKLRVFRPLDQNGSEHQAKETTLLQGELDIGETDCAEGIALGRARLHRCAELSEAFRGDRRKEILLVGKVSIRGCRGHSDAAGRLPSQANEAAADLSPAGARASRRPSSAFS